MLVVLLEDVISSRDEATCEIKLFWTVLLIKLEENPFAAVENLVAAAWSCSLKCEILRILLTSNCSLNESKKFFMLFLKHSKTNLYKIVNY